MAAKTKSASIEDNLAELDKIASQMSDPKVSLEDSFRLYEEGIRRIKECNSAIADVKQKVEILEADGEIKDFKADES